MRSLLVLLVLFGGLARADDRVALLPLDAEAKLEIYGQPVASEVARVLRDANIAIEVIGAKMAVPDSAKLIVDGTIAAGKKNEIVLTLRIRNPIDGVTLATVSSTAAGIANIDKAASDVSARLMTVLRERLAAMKPADKVDPIGNVHQIDAPPQPEFRPVLAAAASHGDVNESEPLRAALTVQLETQLHRVYRTPQLVDPAKMTAALATKTVAENKLDLGMLLEVTSYSVELEDGVPIARAHVRVRVTDAVEMLFDRIIVTDSIVGEKNMSMAALAQRVAREVFDIARPHLKRKVKAWR
jgi:hypothetical protein